MWTFINDGIDGALYCGITIGDLMEKPMQEVMMLYKELN